MSKINNNGCLRNSYSDTAMAKTKLLSLFFNIINFMLIVILLNIVFMNIYLAGRELFDINLKGGENKLSCLHLAINHSEKEIVVYLI